MDMRKVQKVSVGTYVISLPKSWAIRHNVRPGTILGITENAAGSLVLQLHANKAVERTPQINSEHILEESINAHYIAGAQEMIISPATPSIRARTLTALQELPGLEVAEESKASIKVRCSLDENSLHFYGLLDRMCVLLKYGAELTIEGNRVALMQNELEVNKTYHLCERILTRAAHDAVFLEQIGLPLARIIPTLQLLVKRLEHVGDALKDIEKITPQTAKWITALVNMICSMVRMLTAGKLAHAVFPTKQEVQNIGQHHNVPQIVFLIRTLQDVKEELILLQAFFSKMTFL
jgi:phosphate uptake regulator